jgi:hypothetical protein
MGLLQLQQSGRSVADVTQRAAASAAQREWQDRFRVRRPDRQPVDRCCQSAGRGTLGEACAGSTAWSVAVHAESCQPCTVAAAIAADAAAAAVAARA